MQDAQREAIREFIPIIRLYLRDFPELNRLMEGVEHGDKLIEWAIIDTVDDFNSTPPPISFEFSNIPKSILKLGVVATLLESLSFLDTRNALSYSDGGVTVSLEKAPLLMQLQNLLEGKYERKKREWKIAQNIMRGWDNIHSEYWTLSSFWGSF